MSLKLSKNNAQAYDYYSEGDGTDPISVAMLLTNVGGTLTSSTVTAYLVATQFLYSSIAIQPVSEETGVNWQVSLDGSTWAESVAPSNKDGRSVDSVTAIYFRAVVANDNSIPPGYKTAANVSVYGIASA